MLALENDYADQVSFVIVDLDTPEGKLLADQYEVYYIPAFIFLGSDGNTVSRAVGYNSRGDLNSRLQNLLQAEKKRSRP